MKEYIINYLDTLTWEYNQMCQRPDGSIYGIVDGLTCRKGTEIQVYESDSPDLIALKRQGKTVRQLLREKVKEKQLSNHKTYIQAGVRKFGQDIQSVSSLIRATRKDGATLDSLYEGKGSRTDSEIDRLLKRYEENRSKVVAVFSKLRNSLISRGDRDLAGRQAKGVIQKSETKDLPRDKSFYEEGLVDLYRISKNRGETLGELVYWGDRGFARRPKDGRPGIINVGNEGSDRASMATLWHEFGHHLEMGNPELKEAFKGWLLSRSTGKIKTLRELTGRNTFKADEVAYEGDYGLGQYVAKIYKDGGTEVLSKGLERFSSVSRMISFFEKDPEHFMLVLGVLELI